MSRPVSERGSAAFELPLILGLVLLPFGVLVISMSTWVERQTAARDAAGEVTRLVVTDPTVTSADAFALVREIEAGYGLPAGSMTLQLDGDSSPGSSVEARVTVAMPGAVIPLFGSFGDVRWTASHVERAPDFGAIE